VRRMLVAAVTTAALCLGATAAVATPGGRAAAPPLAGTPRAAGVTTIELSVLGTYATGTFDASAAEIVAHDPTTQRLFVVNAESGRIDVLSIADPTAPTKLFEIDTVGLPSQDGSTVSEGAIVNSVAVRGTVIAAAVEADPKTDDGWVVFATVDGEVLTTVRAGALPDMLTFTPDGRTLLVSNEGEPALDYSVDPEGSVSVIPVPRDARQVRQADVRTATFHAWDDGEKVLPEGVRIVGPVTDPARRISENLEPEYIVADDNRTAYVMLQEANAVAVLDVRTATFTDMWPLGFKDHTLPGNELDVSDQDGRIRIENWPVLGMYQPDGFDTYSWRGRTLLVTANEGDSRDWPAFSEEQRFRAFSNDRSVCPGGRVDTWLQDNDLGIATLQELRENTNMGRLTISNVQGLGDGGCIDEVYAFGARSFSIWTADGTQLYDSGSELERITAELEPAFFNSNHREPSFETRSDDKGPEPEDVKIGRIRGRDYAFIGLERIGGVMVYDITDPRAPFFVQWINNRDFSQPPALPDGSANPAAGDLGAEGLLFIEAKDSPTGRPMLAVANEVSGTTTLFDIDTVVSPPGRR
jgi:hypothetical protein